MQCNTRISDGLGRELHGGGLEGLGETNPSSVDIVNWNKNYIRSTKVGKRSGAKTRRGRAREGVLREGTDRREEKVSLNPTQVTEAKRWKITCLL